MELEITVNGAKHGVETDPDRSLLDVLREDLGLTGTKYGCGEGECRACTVLVGGVPMPSCRLRAGRVGERPVLTIEGLATEENLHPVQQAFLDAGAMQCGYCVPGMILATVFLLEGGTDPSEEDIDAALGGNLCRCCGYRNILDAVQRAASTVKEGNR